MIVIVGESGSGKTTLVNNFIARNSEYKRIVTYTTRPMRPSESDGIDYHFVSNEHFDQLVDEHFFVENAEYRGWKYGTALEDCKPDKTIAVLTPAGLRALKHIGYDVTSVYLKESRPVRLIRLLWRGDDVDEAYRRNLSDVGMFDAIENEVDYVIDSSDKFMSELDVTRCLEQLIGKRNDN